MDVAALWHTFADLGCFGQGIAIKKRDALKDPGKRLSGAQAGDAATDDNGVIEHEPVVTPPTAQTTDQVLLTVCAGIVPRMSRILIIGTASQDTLHLPSGIINTIGGAGLYTALAAANAGAETTLFAPRPDPLPDAFAAAAARLTWIGPSVRTEDLPRLEIAQHGGGRATLLGAAWGAEAQLLPGQLPSDLSGFDWMHIAALSTAERMQAFADVCRARGAGHISAGTYFRLVQSAPDAVRALADSCDAFFANENEAAGLFGAIDSLPRRGLRFVTLGARGAWVLEPGARNEVRSPHAHELDPTGAGDTFCGTVLASLAAGAPPRDAAIAGCVAAARMIEKPGPARLLETRPHIPGWHTLSSRVIADHPRLFAVEDEVLLPSGARSRWVHQPRAADFAAVIAINAVGEILLAYQHNHAAGRVVEEFPGGMINEGETPEAAARRELLEETGWHAGSLSYIGAYLAHNRRSRGRGHVVVARDLELRAAEPEAEEIIVTRWLAPEALERAIADGEIENATLLAAWAIFRAQR